MRRADSSKPRGDTAAIGRVHLFRNRSIDVVANLEALIDRGSEIAMRVHFLDQPGLPIVDGRFADRVEADVGYLRLAAKRQRKLIGKGDRLDPGQFRREPAHEARAIVPRSADGLAEFDGILRLEMAAAEVVG
jgi:hypothetical protein